MKPKFILLGIILSLTFINLNYALNSKPAPETFKYKTWFHSATRHGDGRIENLVNGKVVFGSRTKSVVPEMTIMYWLGFDNICEWDGEFKEYICHTEDVSEMREVNILKCGRVGNGED